MNNGFVPTAWQRVIYRNYGTVENEKLGQILGTDGDTVCREAAKLGLESVVYDENWVKKGFVTIIRNNWDICTNGQIRTLLGLSEKEFSSLLSDYDFLDVKLGKKPETEEPKYFSLNKEQEAATEKVREFTEKNLLKPTVRPFDFFSSAPEPVYIAPESFAINERFTSNYCARYDGTLSDDELSDYGEDYLARLAAVGINGVWLQETLRSLALFPFDPSLSQGYEVRVKNLKKLTERCEKFGIGVYLYMNEPRSLPSEFFGRYPELKGQKTEDGAGYCLCTSALRVKEYLYEAVKSIAESVPRLKGIMTITMSENPTHCYSRKWKGEEEGEPFTDCPHCKKRSAEEVAAEINNIFCRALKDGNGYTELIANLWGWSDFMLWDESRIMRGIELLDGGVEVLCVSEFGKDFSRGGVKGKVIDYSISEVGPSEISVKMLKKAKALGHKIWAKIQINNSWECSAVPFLPVFPLMVKHVENLKKIGLDGGLMMGWSLGGYPGGALPLCCAACGNDGDYEKKWFEKTYGECAEKVKSATEIFSEAFENFPFSVDSLYFGGQTLACGNMWTLGKSERESTMVCFTFDDLEKYTLPYGAETYINLLTALTEKWQKGLDVLSRLDGNAHVRQLERVSEAAFIHFESARIHALFSLKKNDPKENRAVLTDCVKRERNLTERLYSLVSEDASIGFEMTNHYYYNANLLLEKLLSLSALEKDTADMNI